MAIGGQLPAEPDSATGPDVPDQAGPPAKRPTFHGGCQGILTEICCQGILTA